MHRVSAMSDGRSLEQVCRTRTLLPAYTKETETSQAGQKKIVETMRALLCWAMLYHEQQVIGLPSYWLADITHPLSVRGLGERCTAAVAAKCSAVSHYSPLKRIYGYTHSANI